MLLHSVVAKKKYAGEMSFLSKVASLRRKEDMRSSIIKGQFGEELLILHIKRIRRFRNLMKMLSGHLIPAFDSRVNT